MKRTIWLTLALAVTWLLWSGNFKPLLLLLGIVSVALTLALAQRMELMRREYFTLDLIPSMLRYWAWLLREIVRANLSVARIILTPSLPISPTMVTIRSPCSGLIGQATLANSITLTPGTLTVDAHEGELRVHCLTFAGARALRQGDMARRTLDSLGAH